MTSNSVITSYSIHYTKLYDHIRSKLLAIEKETHVDVLEILLKDFLGRRAPAIVEICGCIISDIYGVRQGAGPGIVFLSISFIRQL